MIFLYSTGSGGLSVSTFREVQDTDISNNATGFAFISANRAWVVPHQSKKASPEPPARRSISSSPRRWCRCAQLGRPTVFGGVDKHRIATSATNAATQIGPPLCTQEAWALRVCHNDKSPQLTSAAQIRKHCSKAPGWGAMAYHRY